jgi:hypothetical protein
MKKKTSSEPTAIEDKLNQREQQIRDTLTEIIDVIEKYFTIAPFQWIEGPHEELGEKCGFPEEPRTPFNRFDQWFDNWLCELFPEAYEAQRMLVGSGDESGELAFAAQKLGFLCGLLVGSKTRGATREQLLEQSEGYILPTMQWERRRMTEEAEKQGKEAGQ